MNIAKTLRGLLGLLILLVGDPIRVMALDLRGADTLYQQQRLEQRQQARSLGRQATGGRQIDAYSRQRLRSDLGVLRNRSPGEDPALSAEYLQRRLDRERLRSTLNDGPPSADPPPTSLSPVTADPLSTPATPPPWTPLPRHQEGSR